MPTLEDAVLLTKNNPNPNEVVRKADVLYAGIEDAAHRLRQCEFKQLEHEHRLGKLEDRQRVHEADMSTFKKDRDDQRTRIEAAVSKPNDNEKRLEELEKRLRTVEGAVGSKYYKDEPEPPLLAQNAA